MSVLQLFTIKKYPWMILRIVKLKNAKTLRGRQNDAPRYPTVNDVCDIGLSDLGFILFLFNCKSFRFSTDTFCWVFVVVFLLNLSNAIFSQSYYPWLNLPHTAVTQITANCHSGREASHGSDRKWKKKVLMGFVYSLIARRVLLAWWEAC